jgi:hypothetical protein
MKPLYVIEPYLVGSRQSKSLALIIPSDVRKECSIDTSTLFALRIDESTKKITLSTISHIDGENMLMSTSDGLKASSQQASIKVR